MLETLLIIACLGGTSNSCLSSGDAYQHYSGIDKVVEKISKENPILAQTVGAIGLYKERKLYFKVNGSYFYEAKLIGDDLTNIAWFKKEF